MRVREPETDEDVELVRRIRNACREWMTRDTSYITEEQQRKWWGSGPGRLWIFEDVGFGFMSEEGEKMWIAVGILPAGRGKGLGTEMYRFLAEQQGKVWAEIRGDNSASLIAALKAGYVSDELVVLHS